MIAVAGSLSIALASGILAVLYAQAGHVAGAAASLGLALLWGLAQWKRWRWGPSFLLVFAMGVSAFGLSMGLSAVGMLTSGVAALAAIDLQAFHLRLAEIGNVDEKAALVRRHLERTGLVSSVGLALALSSQALRLRFGLTVALILGLLAILGLSRGVAFLRRESD